MEEKSRGKPRYVSAARQGVRAHCVSYAHTPWSLRAAVCSQVVRVDSAARNHQETNRPQQCLNHAAMPFHCGECHLQQNQHQERQRRPDEVVYDELADVEQRINDIQQHMDGEGFHVTHSHSVNRISNLETQYIIIAKNCALVNIYYLCYTRGNE